LFWERIIKKRRQEKGDRRRTVRSLGVGERGSRMRRMSRGAEEQGREDFELRLPAAGRDCGFGKNSKQ